MTRPITAILLVCCLSSVAEACERGSVCWTDLSKGAAITELRFRAQGGERTAVIEPGVSTFRFVEMLKDSPLLPSEWLCVQGRQRHPAGKYSDWYLSEQEGVCHQTAVVLPVSEAGPIDPPPVVVVPPPLPEPSVEIFSGITNSNGLLSFSYKLADCPRGVQQGTSAAQNGQKRITLRCRR